MGIIFKLICASIALAADSAIGYSSSSIGESNYGQPAENESCKFTASFRRENVHFCTASLLSNKHALTTATCLRDFLTEREIPDFDLYTLKAGRFDLPGKSVVFSIEEVQMHRRFCLKMTKSVYDIGIVTMMDNNVTESEYVGWGLVTTPPRIGMVEEAIVTVWANINATEKENKKDNLTLIHNTVEAIRKDECGFNRNSPIICVQSFTENQFFSKEDMGAPLTEGSKLIRGVLAFIQDGLNKPATFINIRNHSKELRRLMTKVRSRHRTGLPRKTAKRNLPKKRRVKPKYDTSDTDVVLI